jgi:hypothetical protein
MVRELVVAHQCAHFSELFGAYQREVVREGLTEDFDSNCSTDELN